MDGDKNTGLFGNWSRKKNVDSTSEQNICIFIPMLLLTSAHMGVFTYFGLELTWSTIMRLTDYKFSHSLVAECSQKAHKDIFTITITPLEMCDAIKLFCFYLKVTYLEFQSHAQMSIIG